MPHPKVDKAVRRKIMDVRQVIQKAEETDCNEAETRRRIERILESLMGYDVLKHLSRERAVRGAGETEYVDFTIQLQEGKDAKPEIMVEIKRISVCLAVKHLKQVSSYAINAGCEWILLTNGKEWQLYHVSFGQPPITKLIYSWNILTDEIWLIADRFAVISYKNLKKGGLGILWEKTNILHPHSLLQAILSEPSLRIIRRELKKDSEVSLSPEDVISGVRRLLNETALAELEKMRVCLEPKKKKISNKDEKQGSKETIDENNKELI
ncbi:MAG: type I restriction enzyme HsdR N-terminal domain-containing protein [Candidatus Omnitrophica bacterium]|nr:type I restriction enzyme HsdR N-terminal domain-containing protein [Candidatus Omnitrophota bacterium]